MFLVSTKTDIFISVLWKGNRPSTLSSLMEGFIPPFETHFLLNRLAAILQTTFWSVFSWMKSFVSWFGLIIIPPPHPQVIWSWKGLYWFRRVRPSVRPSVGRILSALYLPQHSSDPSYIFTCYQATSEGVSHVRLVSKFKNLKFCTFFKFVSLTMSSVDLGSNMTQ